MSTPSDAEVTKQILFALCNYAMWLKSVPTFASILLLGIKVKFVLNSMDLLQ